MGFCRLLLIAGTETTTNLIGNGALALYRHPDQRARLAAQGALLPNALEEMLRFDSPTQALARTLTTDVTLHGVTMRAGRKVLLLFGSANRDDREFDRAEVFDVERDIGRHLAFGHGTHHCLGAALARLEGSAAIGQLLATRPDYVVDTDSLEFVRSGAVRGVKSLRVRSG